MTNAWLRAAGCAWIAGALVVSFFGLIAGAVNVNALVVLGPIAIGAAALGIALLANRPSATRAAALSATAALIVAILMAISAIRSDDAFKAIPLAAFPIFLFIVVGSLVGWRRARHDDDRDLRIRW